MGDARRVVRQVAVAVLLAAVVVTCLRLGWWQLDRFRSANGSWQNLGYTLQWPTFAVFAVVAWWRLRALERRRREQLAESAGAGTPDAGTSDVAASVDAGTPGAAAAVDAGAQGAGAPGAATLGAGTPDTRTPPAEAPAARTPAARTTAAAPGRATVPDEQDDELAAYNRYLAQLNAAAAARKNR